MASALMRKTLKPLNSSILRILTSHNRHLSGVATAGQPESDDQSSDQDVNAKSNETKTTSYASSSPGEVNMPMTSMTGSIVGRRFYKKVTAKEADDGVGWSVMLDSRTLRTPSKRPLKCPTLALATAIAAEWDYQQIDGIRPFTMPLMQLTCTALERVPLTRPKIIEFLVNKFHQDLVFCRETGDSELTKGLLERQVEKIDPLLNWVEAEFGYKPVVYTSLFGGKQGAELTNAFENLLKKTDDFELAAIDAIASAARSLTIAIGVFRGRLQIEEAIELIRLEEDLQVDKWGLVEGGHDIDIADLRVQVSSAAVFLGLSRRH